MANVTEWVERKIPIKMNTDETNYVVMKNELVLGKGLTKGRDKSGLTITAQKLLRLLIMQCMKNDLDFRTYSISAKELAEFLKIDSSNLSREKMVQNLTTALLSEVVLIGDGNPKHEWVAYHWVETARYDGKGTYTFKLSEDMKMYLLELGRNYTQYEIGEILSFRSVYALRIFELITMTLGIQRKKNSIYNNNTESIKLSDETLRMATGTQKRYLKTNDLKKNVLDVAKNEINARDFGWKMDYCYIKEGKKVVGYEFILKDSLYGMDVKAGKWKDQEMFKEDKSSGQLNIFDFV